MIRSKMSWGMFDVIVYSRLDLGYIDGNRCIHSSKYTDP
jgi:hypothetical protein